MLAFCRSSTVQTCCRRFKGSLLRLDYGKKRGCTREEREKERLKHKYKKEFKGALRELRKDSSFLAREKLNEVIQRCVEKPPMSSLKGQSETCSPLCYLCASETPRERGR